jgi:uncharacterized protein (TIGR04255 family)
MRVPISISPCPIIDAVIEVRFVANIDQNAVFGLLYNAIKEDYPGKVETQNVANLQPGKTEIVTSQVHKISNGQYVVQIGHNVLSISSYPEYTGWTNFHNAATNFLNKVHNVGIISEVNRVGMRFINFFEKDIFKNVNLKTFINNNEITYKNTQFKTEMTHEHSISTLAIANSVEIKNTFGSIIDIDTFQTKNLGQFFDCKEEILTEMHNNEKELFFSLLKSEFIESLNPIYTS